MPTKNLMSTPAETAINAAVHSELYASHLYKYIANQMQRIGYFGAQKFFLGEAEDELKHYQIHVDYLNDRGACAETPSLPVVKNSVKTLRAAIQLAYDTELALLNDYVDWYDSCKCTITQQHLLQFLNIQNKAVGEYGDWISRLDRVGDDACGILMIDKELGE